MIRALAIALPVLAGTGLVSGAAGQEADALRPTPDYFAEALFDLSTAQALARACRTVSVDPVRVQDRAGRLLTALEADGFSIDAPQDEMENPEAAIAALQAEFVERHAIEAPEEVRVCEVAMTEIADGSGIGRLLVEVPG